MQAQDRLIGACGARDRRGPIDLGAVADVSTWGSPGPAQPAASEAMATQQAS